MRISTGKSMEEAGVGGMVRVLRLGWVLVAGLGAACGAAPASTSDGGAVADLGLVSPLDDVCAKATTIALVAGAGSATGTTTGARDDFHSGVCGGLGGDVYYRLHLAAQSHLTVRLTTTAVADFAPVVSVLADCPATESATALGCAAGEVSSPTEVELASVGPGDLVIVVDGTWGSAGDFTLDVLGDAALAPPADDLCAAAEALTLVAGAATVTGSTVAAQGEFSSSGCGGSGGDVFYALHLDTAQHVVATVTVPLAGDENAFTPIVTLLDGCPSDKGTELQCGQRRSDGLAQVEVGALPPGDYRIAVDGNSDTNGHFKLEVHTSAPVDAPANDRCAGAIDVPLAQQGAAYVGTADVRTLGASHDTTAAPGGLCDEDAMGYSSGLDVVYHVHIPEGVTSLTADYLRPDGSPLYTDGQPPQGTAAVLLLRKAPCFDAWPATPDTSTEVGCFWNTLTATVTPGTDYFVWVVGIDGLGQPNGQLRLTSN